jgi:hypothetical protein
MGDASDFGFDSTLTSAAILAATAILSAMGTKREIVSAPTKLNAARAKTNKPPIRGHIRQQAHGPQHSGANKSLLIPCGSTMCLLMTRQRRHRRSR